MNKNQKYILIILLISQICAAKTNSTDYTVFNIGIQPALFATNAGLSVNVLNLFLGAGVYINRYGMGTIEKYRRVDNINIEGDEFLENDSAWRSTTIGISFKILKNLYLFAGNCDGEYQIIKRYKDSLSGKNYEIKKFEYFPGYEFGIQYELQKFRNRYSLNAILGLNYALTATKSSFDFWPENPVLIAGLAFGIVRNK